MTTYANHITPMIKPILILFGPTILILILLTLFARNPEPTPAAMRIIEAQALLEAQLESLSH